MTGFSLADHLFNEQTIGQLGAEYGAALPNFDAKRFEKEALSGLQGRALLERLDWLADCLEAQLAADFPAMADQIQAAMPPRLDPTKTDDDFGQFIHATPGILAVRHGLEDHRDRALDLLYEATQRFSMEFYIRPFLNRWPAETLARLQEWATDANYHVRRLVSEGTRPRLPWAKKVQTTHDDTLPLLSKLHADGARFVTRSVANHLNDIAKIEPDLVVATLQGWAKEGQQSRSELNWMTRHALRTLVKDGHPGALAHLGYRTDIDLEVDLTIPAQARINSALDIAASLTARVASPVLVDYVIWFVKKDGKTAPKVFKLKTAELSPGKPVMFRKAHKLKGDATTFRLYPGRHRLGLQVNGRVRARADFELLPA